MPGPIAILTDIRMDVESTMLPQRIPGYVYTLTYVSQEPMDFSEFPIVVTNRDPEIIPNPPKKVQEVSLELIH